MKTILIIEDDPFMGRMYKRIFTFQGFTALWAWNGKEGLEMARKGGVDLILLDIMMPEMNGIQVLEKLKAAADTKKIPVVILTNIAMPEEIEEALSKGALKYMIKSEYEPKQVVKVVEDLLK